MTKKTLIGLLSLLAALVLAVLANTYRRTTQQISLKSLAA